MSDDFDGGDFDSDSDNHEHEIPDDLTDDVQERIDQAVEDRMGDLYEDSRLARAAACSSSPCPPWRCGSWGNVSTACWPSCSALTIKGKPETG